MKFVNLTPHDITIRTVGGDTVVPASGQVARVSVDYTDAGDINGIPVVARKMGDVEGIPAHQDGVVYIVSAMVAGATDRDDVVAPDTGPTAVRNDKGHIVAVTRLVKAG